MTAIAVHELDVRDLEAAGSRVLWERAVRDASRPVSATILRGLDESPFTREVGDLHLAHEDTLLATGAETSSELQHQRSEVVVVLPDLGHEEPPTEEAPKRTLTLPRAVLVAAGCDSNLPSRLVLEQDRPLVGVLWMVLNEAWRRVPAMNASEIEATRGALVALTAGAIRAGSGLVAPRSGLPALRARIEAWIDDNLRNGPIHIDALAAAHSVSARTVHRAFAATGDTMTAVVRARRIAAAREDLVHTELTIASIAHRWSYYDPSHLGREFRRHFGTSPTEYRESHSG